MPNTMKIEKKKERAKLLIDELDEAKKAKNVDDEPDDKRPVSLRKEGGLDKWYEQHLDLSSPN